MAKMIQAWSLYGPRLAKADPMEAEEIIERLVMATNQTRGSVLAVLSELDDTILLGLRNGRIVKLPNGTHFVPVGKKNGQISVRVRVNPRISKQLQADFRGSWINRDRIGISADDMRTFWNNEHPDDLIED